MKRFVIFASLSLFLAVPASAQLSDVQCKVSGGQFVCRVGRGDDPNDLTQAVTNSIHLFRADAAGFIPICADMPTGVDVVLVGFVILFEPSVKPQMKAVAFDRPGCIGGQSIASENSGIVTHRIPKPKMER